MVGDRKRVFAWRPITLFHSVMQPTVRGESRFWMRNGQWAWLRREDRLTNIQGHVIHLAGATDVDTYPIQANFKRLACWLFGHAEGAFHRPGGGFMGGSRYNPETEKCTIIKFCQRCYAEMIEEE